MKDACMVGGFCLSIFGSCVCGRRPSSGAGERRLDFLPESAALVTWTLGNRIRDKIYADELPVCPWQGLLRSTAPQ